MQDLHPIKHSETFPTALKHVEKLMLRDRLKTCFILIYVQKEVGRQNLHVLSTPGTFYYPVLISKQ